MKERQSIKNKRVLLITSNFAPEFTGIAVYTYDLANEILSDAEKVTVVTGLPHYPWWRAQDEATSRDVDYQLSTKNIEVIRFKHYIPKQVSLKTRLMYEVSILINGIMAIRSLKHKYDVVIAVVPSVSSGIIARFYSRSKRIPALVIVQDLSSAAALQAGIASSNFFHRIAVWVEKFAIAWPDAIMAISEEMGELIENMIQRNLKIQVIHNYTTINDSPISHKQARESLGIFKNKFLLVHSGNIGFKQNLMNLVHTAKILRSDPQIHFLVIGHGNQEYEFWEAIQDLPNFSHLSFVPSEEFLCYLRAADALLLNERSSLKEMCLPSKITAYSVAQRPLIAAVSRQSASFRLLQNYALCVDADDPRKLADAILAIKSNQKKRDELIKRMRYLKNEKFNAIDARKRILELIEGIIPYGS